MFRNVAMLSIQKNTNALGLACESDIGFWTKIQLPKKQFIKVHILIKVLKVLLGVERKKNHVWYRKGTFFNLHGQKNQMNWITVCHFSVFYK